MREILSSFVFLVLLNTMFLTFENDISFPLENQDLNFIGKFVFSRLCCLQVKYLVGEENDVFEMELVIILK